MPVGSFCGVSSVCLSDLTFVDQRFSHLWPAFLCAASLHTRFLALDETRLLQWCYLPFIFTVIRVCFCWPFYVDTSSLRIGRPTINPVPKIALSSAGENPPFLQHGLRFDCLLAALCVPVPPRHLISGVTGGTQVPSSFLSPVIFTI